MPLPRRGRYQFEQDRGDRRSSEPPDPGVFLEQHSRAIAELDPNRRVEKGLRVGSDFDPQSAPGLRRVDPGYPSPSRAERHIHQPKVQEAQASQDLGLTNKTPCHRTRATLRISATDPEETMPQLVDCLVEPRVKVKVEPMDIILLNSLSHICMVYRLLYMARVRVYVAGSNRGQDRHESLLSPSESRERN
jgi:hypothetical protein